MALKEKTKSKEKEKEEKKGKGKSGTSSSNTSYAGGGNATGGTQTGDLTLDSFRGYQGGNYRAPESLISNSYTPPERVTSPELPGFGSAPRASGGYAALRSSMEDYDPAPTMTYEQATARAQRSYEEYQAKQKAFDEKYGRLENPERYYGYRQRSQELGRLQEECVKLVDHMRSHYMEMDVEPLFTLSGPVEDPEPYQQQVSAMMSAMEDYIESTNGLPDPTELQRQQTQIVRLQNAVGLGPDAEEEKGYWERSLEQVLLGNYSDEVTLAGTAGQVLLGMTGLDVVTDLRDLSYDLTHFKEAGLGQTLLDAVGLIPGLGILKNADEVVTLLKNALPQLMPYADEMATVLRQAFQNGGLGLGALAGGTRYVDDLAETAANGKYVDEASGTAKRLSNGTSGWTGQSETGIVNIKPASGDQVLQRSASPSNHDFSTKPKHHGVMDLETREYFQFSQGTRIQNAEVFAGKGTKKEFRNAERYASRYGGKPEDWQHAKGHGVVETMEGDRQVEVHWVQCSGVGKFEFFIKRWEDE